MPISTIEQLIADMEALKRRVTDLERIEQSNYIRFATTNVSSPPTDSEMDTAFGQPATVGAGFMALVDDNNANTTFWLITCNGTSWQYEELTKAV
jgi:hypothetical protein